MTKWLSQVFVRVRVKTNTCEKKRSESKGEKERYNHLNTEFQRIARRDKKTFLNDQCKEREGNTCIPVADSF